MPTIAFRLGEKTHDFELGRKVTKEDLYGKLRKLVTKGDEVLERGYLTASGAPVPANRISSVGLDPECSPIEKETVLYDGEERAPLPSSFEYFRIFCDFGFWSSWEKMFLQKFKNENIGAALNKLAPLNLTTRIFKASDLKCSATK